ARRPEELSALSEQLGPDRLVTCAGAIDDPDHRADAIRTAVDAHGLVNALVNNAAANHQFGPLIQADPRRVDRALHTNVVAPLEWAQTCFRPGLSDGGAIVNISSVGG